MKQNAPKRKSSAGRNLAIVIVSGLMGALPLVFKNGCHVKVNGIEVNARTNDAGRVTPGTVTP